MSVDVKAIVYRRLAPSVVDTISKALGQSYPKEADQLETKEPILSTSKVIGQPNPKEAAQSNTKELILSLIQDGLRSQEDIKEKVRIHSFPNLNS